MKRERNGKREWIGIVTGIALSLHCFAQQTPQDSIRFIILEKRVDRIQINIEKYHRQTMTGIWFTAAGAAVLLWSTTVTSETQQQGGAYAGAALSFVGLINIIDANKYWRRASKKEVKVSR